MSTAALSNPLGIKLQVTGMTCASCVMRVEKTLKAVPGVKRGERQPGDGGGICQCRCFRDGGFADRGHSQGRLRRGDHRNNALVEGMTCASCVARVEKALRKVPGVSGATVNLATEKATIQALSTVPVSALKAAIEKAGYAAKDVQQDRPHQPLGCRSGGQWRSALR
jgi:Cu+-exporting ATPase